MYGKSWGFKSAGALCSYPTPFSISWQNRKLSLNLGPVEASKPAVEQVYCVTPKKKHHFDASDGEDLMSRIESNFADIHLRPVASKHTKKKKPTRRSDRPEYCRDHETSHDFWSFCSTALADFTKTGAANKGDVAPSGGGSRSYYTPSRCHQGCLIARGK